MNVHLLDWTLNDDAKNESREKKTKSSTAKTDKTGEKDAERENSDISSCIMRRSESRSTTNGEYNSTVDRKFRNVSTLGENEKLDGRRNINSPATSTACFPDG